jgi:surfactin synthase thioesterase subunit
MQAANLFCIPHAGGSATSYYSWMSKWDQRFRIIPLELPGRGIRFKDQAYETIEEVVADFYDVIQPHMETGVPYALFGHSMGAIIAFELCHKLSRSGGAKPIHCFFSGSKAPHLVVLESEERREWTNEKIIQKITTLGGTPQAVLQDEEMLKLYLPQIRSDFLMLDDYKFDINRAPLDINISVIGGKEDDITKEELIVWRQNTTGMCNVNLFAGGHFYLFHTVQRITDYVRTRLYEELSENTANGVIG